MGTVVDANSGKPISFASIRRDETIMYSDIDGRFSLDKKAEFLISHVGYLPKTINSVTNHIGTIYLTPLKNYLKEYKLSENAASPILSKIIARKNRNNPQSGLSSFRVNAYSRLLITANPDSISGRIDSVMNAASRRLDKIDSSDYRFKRFISKQHLFLSEKVSDFAYTGNTLKENIIGARTAGFAQPVYELMAMRLQSFSVYGESFELLQTRYNGPLAQDSREDYRYLLLDSLEVDGRKCYTMAFLSAQA